MSTPDALNAFGLTGRTALVTGAASGIGRATATLFSAVGARVMLVDLNVAAAKAAASEINAEAAGCDISESDQVEALFADVRRAWGGLDILVNCAAYRQKADTMAMPTSEWDVMHAVTTRGTFLCMREAIKIMRQQSDGGSIVNVSSVSAKHPTIFSNMHYDSAKAGVDAMTRAAAIEFAPQKIRVNSVQPGGTASGGAAAIRGTSKITGPMTEPGRIAMGRSAQPIEQARAILFLASPAASYITGHHLTVDGGYHVS